MLTGRERYRHFRRLILIALLSPAMAGMALANGGEGPAPGAEGALCGTIAGLACAQGLWCDPDPGLCGGADIAGRCVSSSGYCTRDYRPVCGCDGKTYPNDCERRAARAPKRHDGACKP